MDLPVVTSWPAPLAASRGDETGVQVAVMLLGVRVTAHAIINGAEHRRREAAGLGAVINPALLDRLMDLPLGIPVTDPVVWAEMADQPRGVAELGEDCAMITRRLESPLTMTDVVVDAPAGQELHAVRDASLFAGFTRRWIEARSGRISDATMLEAKLCGVGIVDQRHRQQLPAEKPQGLTRDGWSWLLEEKAYRRWLTQRAGSRERERPARATGGASDAGAG